MHHTLEKFGYPATLVKEFDHWCVLLRPSQVTLGALVLVSKSNATSLAALPQEAFAELHACCTSIDASLKKFRSFDKLNYLALMMVDPQVHFHVLPRYASAQEFEGIVFNDTAWPGPPDLKSVTALSHAIRNKLQGVLIHAFANAV
jgi:diadenosine tetraphosphate (Ap4A) HIT family hydrolase